jgi:hypothetical protein
MTFGYRGPESINAFFGARSALPDTEATSETAFSADGEAAWLKGMQLVRSGNIFKGILFLDSLRISGLEEERFLYEYAASVLRVLIPEKEKKDQVSLLEGPPSIEEDTVAPTALQWKVLSVNLNKNSLPSFSYGATYFFRKPYKLTFNGLLDCHRPGGLLRLDPVDSPAYGSCRYKELFTVKREPVRVRVYIDLNNTDCSLFDYLKERVDGNYDSVAVKTDLAEYSALSLRCYRNSYMPGRDGIFAAYVTFDRRLGDISKVPFLKEGSKVQYALKKIRFTIALETTDDIQPLAEAKLQKILKAF